MSACRILQLGDPLLRAVSAPVATPAEAGGVFRDLRDTLHEFQRTHGFGRGISAVQIGEPKRLIYIELEGRAYCLRNPEYEWQSEEKFQFWDDCFSFPDLLVRLERSVAVRVRYWNEAGFFGVAAARNRSSGRDSGGGPGAGSGELLHAGGVFAAVSGGGGVKEAG
jgi:peptide deformylase